MSEATIEIIYFASTLLITAGLLLLGRVAYSKLSRYDCEHQLTDADNPAVGIALFGFLGGLLIVVAGLITTEGALADDPVGIAWDLVELVVYGAVAVLLLNLSGWLNDRFILHKFKIQKELVDDRNIGVGAALAGSYLASGLILAGAFAGRMDPGLLPDDLSRGALIGYELGVAIVYFGIGQVALALYGRVYQLIQPRDVHSAIADDYEVDGVTHGGNAAAGLAFGANLAALGLIMWGAARHDFTGWSDGLIDLGIAALIGLVALPLWRIFVDKVMLARADLAKEIYEDRNTNAALLEAASLLALAMPLALLL